MTKSTPLALALAYPGFSRRSRTTDTRSDSIASKAARVTFLDGYLELKTDVDDVRFHVRFRDNGIMSSPSDWHIVAAVKISPDDSEAWLDGLSETDASHVNLAWWNGLDLSSDARFTGTGAPRFFQREGRFTFVVVYENGVLLKLVSTRDPNAPDDV
jgi:hypothetical protein